MCPSSRLKRESNLSQRGRGRCASRDRRVDGEVVVAGRDYKGWWRMHSERLGIVSTMDRQVISVCALLVLAAPSCAATLVSQSPVSGGGVTRWSQLWQDPGPDGNNLDSDAICWEDFSAAWPVTIERLEWWGTGACELGFQVEFWKQDRKEGMELIL